MLAKSGHSSDAKPGATNHLCSIGITRSAEAVYQALYEHGHAHTPVIKGARVVKRHHVVVTSTYLRGWEQHTGRMVLGNRADDSSGECWTLQFH